MLLLTIAAVAALFLIIIVVLSDDEGPPPFDPPWPALVVQPRPQPTRPACAALSLPGVAA